MNTPCPFGLLPRKRPPLPWPAWLAGLALCLGLLWAVPAAAQAPATEAFTLQVDAPEDLAQDLLRHLELQRYRGLTDLDEAELQRLLAAADVQARELLAAWGHFAPELEWHSESAPPPGPAWRIQLRVVPGPSARVQAMQWRFAGDIADSPAQQDQRLALQREWSLPAGQVFTQAAWSAAKAAALRRLNADHYPLGQIAHSEAQVDAEQHRVVLQITLDSGPQVRLGPVQVIGSERYSEEQARRLARLRSGQPYHANDLLEAQQHLVLSGFYDAVFVALDTEGPPEAMPVRIELKETLRQRWQLGVGVRSDTGPRLSVEHTQHRVPGLDWRAVTRLSLDRVLQSASVDLLSPPSESLWRWGVAGRAEHQQLSGYELSSQRLRAGRSQLGERIDRHYYLQYDNADTTGEQAGSRNAASAHYAWTWRYFDSLPFPRRGWGLGLEVGSGTTLGTERVPYARSYARALWLLPLGSRGMRLALRGEAGAVATRNADNIPSTQLFLAGGERSVRGYGPGSIGVTGASGAVSAGRYLGTGSVEWQIPIRRQGRPSDWEALLFWDAGAVANRPAELRQRLQHGVGVGARWQSPVGPLEIDLARAIETGRWRVHLAVGFRF